jgi:hypothetical protein
VPTADELDVLLATCKGGGFQNRRDMFPLFCGGDHAPNNQKLTLTRHHARDHSQVMHHIDR